MISPIYKPCNCSRPHLTKEHLFTEINWTQDGQGTFSMKNPYYKTNKPNIERRGRPRKYQVKSPTSSSSLPLSNEQGPSQTTRWTPEISSTSIQHQKQQTIGQPNGSRVIRKPFQQSTTTINPSNGSLVSRFKPKTTPTATSPAIPTKYDVWHSIKSTFQECRKLCDNGPTSSDKHPNRPGKVIHRTVRDKSDHYTRSLREETNWISPLDRIPFRSPPGSVNGVTVFSMKNPFANKSKVNTPIDEITRLYYETIDTIEPESSQQPSEIDPTNIEHLINSSIFPLTPISPNSPMSTTSSPIEDHSTLSTINFEDEPTTIEREVKVKIEGGDTVIFKEIGDYNLNRNILPENSSPMTTTIFDDICITDFNEYEFDQMISDLPDVI